MARSEAVTAAADRAVVEKAREVEAKHRQFTGKEIILENEKNNNKIILRAAF